MKLPFWLARLLAPVIIKLIQRPKADTLSREAARAGGRAASDAVARKVRGG